ncbi:hypothetical protein PFISCL1PPCAC_9115, partial [Pristionchus fissidentatus]
QAVGTMRRSQDDTNPNRREYTEPEEMEEESRTTPNTPQQRNRKTKTAKYKDRKLDRFIQALSHERYAKQGHHYNFKFNDVLQILIWIKAVLMTEKPLVKCLFPCVVVGDIHGQFTDLFRLFSYFNDGETAGYLTQRYVFLGDYIDRGKQSLETIVFVFLLKIKFPKSIFLLRGNHESKPINRVYGFMNELVQRFDQDRGNDMFHM